MKNSNKGFTLIELLIVIALLGALAVGLLAALDPFEQLKKGTDTSIRNTVSEYQGAIIRFYAIKNQMPWCADAACGTFKDGLADVVTNKTIDLMPQTTANIVATGELKADFETLAGIPALQKISVYGSNTAASIEVCFKPQSKSITNDPNTKYTAEDGLTGCVSTGDPSTNTCLWCVK